MCFFLIIFADLENFKVCMQDLKVYLLVHKYSFCVAGCRVTKAFRQIILISHMLPVITLPKDI